MRHARSFLLVATLLFAFSTFGVGTAMAAEPEQCQQLAAQYKAAKTKLKHLDAQRDDAQGRHRRSLSRRVASQRRKVSRLRKKLIACRETAGASTDDLKADCDFDDAGPGETRGSCRAYRGGNRRRAAPRIDTAGGGGITAIKAVLPGGRQVTNYICPSQLPTAQIATTNTPNDSLMCYGGSMPIGTQAAPTTFTFNIRMTPNPAPGMGGALFLTYGSVFGPFPITGP